MANDLELKAQAERTAAEQFLATAQATAITNAQQNEAAGAYLKEIKAKAKEIEAVRVSFVKPLNDQVKVINDWFKRPLDILSQAEAAVKRVMLAWDQAERKRVAEEEARLREEARKREEAERAKLEKRASKAEASGKEEKAEELRQQAAMVSVPAPVLAPPPRASGVQVRKSWDFEITDPALVPREYLEINEVKIRKVVLALKGDTSIPGIRVFEKESVAA